VYALSEEELTGARVVKLFPIVALDCLDAGTELSRGVSDEVGKRAESVRYHESKYVSG
jgi:hypothetical protein